MVRKLRLAVDSIESFGDEQVLIKDLYVERDGKFYFAGEPAEGLTIEDVSGLRSALEKERKTAADAEAKAKEVADKYDGIEDPGSARDAMAKLKEMEDWSDPEKVDELVAQKMRTHHNNHKTELSKRDARENALLGEVKRLLVDAEVSNMMNTDELKGSSRLALGVIRDCVQIKEEDGKFSAVILDDDGTTPRINEDLKPMRIADKLAEMKKTDEFSRIFDGPGVGGTDSTSVNGGPGDSGNANVDPSLPPEDRMAAFRAAGKTS